MSEYINHQLMRLKLNSGIFPKFGFGIALLVLFVGGCKPKSPIENPPADGYNFFVVSDMGSSGPYREDSVAKMVNKLSGKFHPRYVINQGDFFHDSGVKDTLDPLWTAQFEKMFTAPELNVKWYSVIGNHEYIGNPQALVDYGKHNARWTMPARNYTFVQKVDSATSIRFIMIDTAPFVLLYRHDSKYHAVNDQNPGKNSFICRQCPGTIPRNMESCSWASSNLYLRFYTGKYLWLNRKD